MEGERKVGHPSIAIDPRHAAAERRVARRQGRLASIIIGALLLIVAGILVAGYVVKFVLPPRQVVVRVNDVSYTRGDLVNLLRLQQRGSELLGIQFLVGNEILGIIQRIIENEIIAHSAPEHGISVSNEEIEARIRATLMSVGGEVSLDPAQAELEFREQNREFLDSAQLSLTEHRDLVRNTLLREKFKQFIGASVPVVAEQVRLHRIVILPTDELAAMEREYEEATEGDLTPVELRDAFKMIVRKFSRDDSETVRKGGDLGWIPVGVLPDHEETFFSLKSGELSERLLDVDSSRRQTFIYFMVSDREDSREIRDEHREILKDRALTDWVNGEREKFEVFSQLNSEIYAWIVTQVLIAAPE